MKNSLHFKHFRKFKDFQTLEFNDITFLVGKNNSGKSTFVKAILLVFNYLKSSSLKTIDFNERGVDYLNIATFERAYSKNASVKKDGDFIDFKLKIENYEFFIKIIDNQNNVQAKVMLFEIVDHDHLFSISINPTQNSIRIKQSSNIDTSTDPKIYQKLHKIGEEIKITLTKMENPMSPEYINLKSKLEKTENDLKKLKITNKSSEANFDFYAHYEKDNLFEILNEFYTNKLESYHFMDAHFDKSKKDLEKLDFNFLYGDKSNKLSWKKELQNFYEQSNNIQLLFSNINDFISRMDIVYLSATLQKQSALYSIRDESNPLSVAIHEFNKLKTFYNEEANSFLKKWLLEFEIGEIVISDLIGGEAYEIFIENNGNKIPLADKGMGTIQSVLLILRIVTVIHKSKNFNKNILVIIEEPELNLHPALQSKLCDLFYDVFEKYGIRFIIETHSEYIIRKTQLLVKENEFEIKPNDNPFSVIYFNSDSKVWNMNYREDGRFKNEFGSGFFDESTNLTFELL